MEGESGESRWSLEESETQEKKFLEEFGRVTKEDELADEKVLDSILTKSEEKVLSHIPMFGEGKVTVTLTSSSDFRVPPSKVIGHYAYKTLQESESGVRIILGVRGRLSQGWESF